MLVQWLMYANDMMYRWRVWLRGEAVEPADVHSSLWWLHTSSLGPGLHWSWPLVQQQRYFPSNQIPSFLSMWPPLPWSPTASPWDRMCELRGSQGSCHLYFREEISFSIWLQFLISSSQRPKGQLCPWSRVTLGTDERQRSTTLNQGCSALSSRQHTCCTRDTLGRHLPNGRPGYQVAL